MGPRQRSRLPCCRWELSRERRRHPIAGQTTAAQEETDESHDSSAGRGLGRMGGLRQGSVGVRRADANARRRSRSSVLHGHEEEGFSSEEAHAAISNGQSKMIVVREHGKPVPSTSIADQSPSPPTSSTLSTLIPVAAEHAQIHHPTTMPSPRCYHANRPLLPPSSLAELPKGPSLHERLRSNL